MSHFPVFSDSIVPPPGSGTNISLSITVAGQQFNGNVFQYTPPSIASVRGCTTQGATTIACPVNGSQPLLTINGESRTFRVLCFRTGLNFGTNPAQITVLCKCQRLS